MKKEKIKWGILGAGNIARSFAEDFPLVKNGELVAVAARDSARAKQFAAAYKIPFAFTYDELYNSNEVDAGAKYKWYYSVLFTKRKYLYRQ